MSAVKFTTTIRVNGAFAADPNRPSDRDLFMVRVDPQPNGCWFWRGNINTNGYGLFALYGQRRIGAHRAAWELTRGPIPQGMIVCHRCDNPRCVNPEHLFIGTHLDNARDRVSKGRGRYPGPKNPATGNRNGSYTKPERVRRGTQVNTCKLNDEKVKEIRARHAAGTTAYRIACELGMDKKTIQCLVDRKSWKHVE